MRTCSIIVTCTYRKSFPADPSLRFENYKAFKPNEQIVKWVESVVRAPLRSSAIDVYQGNYWSAVKALAKSISESNSDVQLRIFIASAGMGLISISDPIPSYDATFTPNLSNSIGDKNTSVEWWNELNLRMERMDLGSLFSTSDFTYIATSQNYLDVLLNRHISAKRMSDDVAIFSKNKVVTTTFQNNTLGYVADFERLLGGTRDVQLLRLIARIFESDVDPFNLLEVRKFLASLKAGGATTRKYNRSVLDDEAIAKWINSQLGYDRKYSSSFLLRKLRNSGYACEQRRFRNIFTLVKGRYPYAP